MQLMPNHSKTVVPRQESRESFSPKSLFTLSAELVAHNLMFVDTFSTIPEIVGETLFEVARETGQFDHDGCSACLEPFTSAYSEAVLECLAVRDSERLVQTCGAELQQFLHLTECDMSNCGITDDNEILIHIGTRLHGLEVLLLADNILSDAGIQRLTACTRVMSKGLRNLRHLDLSGNKDITDKMCLYLRSFDQLTTLNLSRCRITVVGKFSLRKHLSLSPCDSSEPGHDIIVRNKGWAAAVIENWRNQYSSRQTSRLNFYAKKEKPPRNDPCQCPLIFMKEKKTDKITAKTASTGNHSGNVGTRGHFVGRHHFPGTGSKIGSWGGGSVPLTTSDCTRQLLPNGGKGLLSDQNLLRCYSGSMEPTRTADRDGGTPHGEKLSNVSHVNCDRGTRTGTPLNSVTKLADKIHGKQPGRITGKRKVIQKEGTAKRKRIKLVGQRHLWNINQEGNSLDHDSPVLVDGGEDGMSSDEGEVSDRQRSVFDYLD